METEISIQDIELVIASLKNINPTRIKNKDGHGFDSLVIEAQLSHKDCYEVQEAYNHNDYLEDRAELIEWWDTFLTGFKVEKKWIF